MSRGGFLSGVLLGLALGGVIAMLYAPEKGDKTRKKLAKRSGKWRETASDAMEMTGDLVGKGRKRVGI
ncbi:MAG TPA: YtxH domain-containing protein [Gemmatimonadota bacterium]|nr:YtxH domain-containing protein [Gemmatimonadota bacterium]